MCGPWFLSDHAQGHVNRATIDGPPRPRGIALVVDEADIMAFHAPGTFDGLPYVCLGYTCRFPVVDLEHNLPEGYVIKFGVRWSPGVPGNDIPDMRSEAYSDAFSGFLKQGRQGPTRRGRPRFQQVLGRS